jgi:hypothetical protein
MRKTGHPRAKRRTLYAMIAKESDLLSKYSLAKYGPSIGEDEGDEGQTKLFHPLVGMSSLAIVEYWHDIMKGKTAQQRDDACCYWYETMEDKMAPPRGDPDVPWWALRKLAYMAYALIGWHPEALEKLAKQMRRAERGDFDALRGAKTAWERDLALKVIEGELDKTSTRRLALEFCREHVGCAKLVDSVERQMRRLRKKFALPPRRNNGGDS